MMTTVGLKDRAKIVCEFLTSLNYRYELHSPQRQVGAQTVRMYELFGAMMNDDDMLRMMLSECSDDGVIYDIGASDGTYSIALANKFPEATIHAFEPNPMEHEKMQKNLAINPDCSNVITHEFGLSDEAGESTFYVTKPATRSSFDPGYVDRVRAVLKEEKRLPV